MNKIEIETIATVFAGEFIKETTRKGKSSFGENPNQRIMDKDFLKMSYPRRRKIIEKILDKMEKH